MHRTTAPLRLGLTGGIGSGKSTVAALWRAAGHRVIDLDAHSRRVLDVPGQGVEDAVARPGGRAGPGGSASAAPRGGWWAGPGRAVGRRSRDLGESFGRAAAPTAGQPWPAWSSPTPPPGPIWSASC